MIMEDMETETSTALVQNDDPDSIKHKGCKLMVFRDIFTYHADISIYL